MSCSNTAVRIKLIRSGVYIQPGCVNDRMGRAQRQVMDRSSESLTCCSLFLGLIREGVRTALQS